MMSPEWRLRTAVVSVVLAVLLTAGACLAADGELTFAVFGDCRPGLNYERLDITRRIMRGIARRNPAFVIGTGDYIEGSTDQQVVRAQYARFFEALMPLKLGGLLHPEDNIPVALATGNHDIRGSAANAEIFEDYFGGRQYSFDRANCHFIILDSEIPGQQGCIKGRQWQWLLKDIQAAQDAGFIFVALHRPLFPVDGHRGSSMDVDVPLRDRLHALFVKYRVSAVFVGHEHLYNHSRRDGVDYFITAGAGAPLYASPQNGGYYHHLVVTVTASDYQVEVIPLNVAR